VFSDQQGLLDLPLPALKGRHQIENAALAIAALRHCFNDLAPEAFAQGMKEVTWPARLQRLKKGPLVDVVPDGAEVWLDGGHNQSGGQALALSLTDLNPHNQRPVVMICASLTTKDTKSFLQPFHGKIDHLIAIPLTAPSAASSSGEHAGHSPAFIAQWAGECGIDASSAASLQEALCHPMIQKASPPPLILIAGSLYLAGTVLHLNEQWPN
jgi:dihydrofolate synthase/folylpolyglutamate synthase